MLWDGEFDAWQAYACDRANRNLAPSEWERYLGSKPEPPTCPNLAPGEEPARRPPATPAVASGPAAGVPGRG